MRQLTERIEVVLYSETDSSVLKAKIPEIFIQLVEHNDQASRNFTKRTKPSRGTLFGKMVVVTRTFVKITSQSACWPVVHDHHEAIFNQMEERFSAYLKRSVHASSTADVTAILPYIKREEVEENQNTETTAVHSGPRRLQTAQNQDFCGFWSKILIFYSQNYRFSVLLI